ncbi:hypothetical protein TARUN_372 [Trichoderma arundinaceum]|uniref:Uncharacterized protein n=1 Tax=Trichoderma arundinaceum TaxID=490622 RepID=A0A395P1B1_TRIAR|nr:hypothetical protein TARUN_372 [Trichoderma arundinaceum]
MSSAKATKKSAFSCEPCRRRKAVQPDGSRDWSGVRLEDRIKDLEEQLAKATAATPPTAADSKSPASTHSSPSPFGGTQHDARHQVDDSISRSFRGLKIDDKGGITYHGTTSFFNLPSERSSAAVAVDLHATAADIESQRRERLVSNAWQQRVLEEHSGIPIMFDDSAENELWVPFGAPQLQTAPWKYPPSTAHSASCFLSMCRLSVIFNEILIHMYDPLMQNTESEVQECLIAQEPALQQWWDELAPYLKLDPMALPALAPPSHIVTTNCLYHTFKVLLYRPMLTRRNLEDDVASHKRYLVECVTSATAIIAIFDLFCRTFTMNYCVLSLAYSLYIASSIFLLQVQAAPDDGQALGRLNYCIQALKQVKTFSPVIGSAIDLLNKELSAIGISLDVQEHYQPPSAPAPDFHQQSPMYQPVGIPSSQPQPAHPLFQVPSTQSYSTHNMAMDPGIFEAMSSLEPLSVRVGALPNTENPNPF